MPGIGKYKKGAKFTLKSGNKPSPMNLYGVSPMKEDKSKNKPLFSKGGLDYDPDIDYQRAANQYYLITGKMSGVGSGNYPKDATSDMLYHHMVRQSSEGGYNPGQPTYKYIKGESGHSESVHSDEYAKKIGKTGKLISSFKK